MTHSTSVVLETKSNTSHAFLHNMKTSDVSVMK